MRVEQLHFHKGIDYAVVMRPRQTTENALCRLYGEDRHVTKFGNMFAASTDMLLALKTVAALENSLKLPATVMVHVYAAIKKAEGKVD